MAEVGNANDGLNVKVGLLLEAVRARAGVSQAKLALRARTSQQWVSRVERGEVDLRLGDAERLFAGVGARLLVRTAGSADWAEVDPDLLPAHEGTAEALQLAVQAQQIVWKRFRGVPHLVGGRIAALAHGLRVRPLGVDLVVAEAAVAAAGRALAMMNVVRWSDRRQGWTLFDRNVGAGGAQRWRMSSGDELRFEIVRELPAGLSVRVDEWDVPVVPLPVLLRGDPDVAELARRLGER